jgi:menaquinone-dependent protoporphyrinogen oxidase
MEEAVKVLVTAASRHGATQEIAEAIGRTLSDRGVAASVVPISDVTNLDGYDAVVVGSAVYMGQWLESARTFAERYSVPLSSRPTWLFSSGPIGDPPRPKESEAVDVDEIVSNTQAKEHHLFAGKLDKSKLGFGERAVMLAFRAVEGDYRDWSEIEAWAGSIGEELRP